MNKRQVLAMTDEELRIKAAELMGWEWSAGLFEFCNGVSSRGAWWSPREGGSIMAYAADTKDCVDALPDYPNDIAAAWELFYKMLGLGCVMDAGIEYICDDDETSGIVYFYFRFADKPRMRWFMMTIKSIPKAITRAFILAMEAE